MTASNFDDLKKKYWRIPLFFRFLQISPMYRKAFEHIHLGGDLPDAYNFAPMIKTAERFGDVWGLSFDDWWTQHGEHHLGVIEHIQPKIAARYYGISLASPDEVDDRHLRSVWKFDEDLQEYLNDEIIGNGNPDTMMLAIPVNGDPKLIEQQVLNLLRGELKKLPSGIRRRPRVKFLKNKVRQRTMEKCLFAVYRRAQFYDDVKLHQLGEAIDREYPPSDNKIGDTETLRIQTSDLLRKALFIAEWAAVGEFPNSSPHQRKPYKKYIQSTETFFDNTPIAGGKQVFREAKTRVKWSEVEKYDLKFDWAFIKQQIELGNIDPEFD